jgi:hypothetical protein
MLGYIAQWAIAARCVRSDFKFTVVHRLPSGVGIVVAATSGR